MKHNLGFDLGTGAIKGVCWHPRRGVVCSLSERVKFSSPEPGRMEISPQDFLDQVLRMIRQLAQAANTEIGAIAFAAASGNTLLCSAKAVALYPVISWLDKRLDWTPPAEWRVREVTGWPAIPAFPLMHLEWFRREHPGLLRNAAIGMNNDFLCWKLCGRRALDSSSATPFYLQDQQNCCWHQPYLSHYGIKETQLPELLKSGSRIGTLNAEFAVGNLTTQTRLTAGSFDHPAGARAEKVTRPDEMLISCGTSWVGFYPVERRSDIPQDELCDPFQSAAGGCWGAMFSLAGVGVEIEDFVLGRYGAESSRYEQFNAEALESGTPARALMQSVIARFVAKLGTRRPRRLVMSGGPAEGQAWPRLLEEALHFPVEVSSYRSYAGAVGAAMLAAGESI
ncbi:MAG: FGGY family carbohydrate kinase [Lentisphaeria bacterium]